MGLQSLNKKGKRKRILVVVVEKRCRENRLLIYIIPKCYHFNVVVLVFKVAPLYLVLKLKNEKNILP